MLRGQNPKVDTYTKIFKVLTFFLLLKTDNVNSTTDNDINVVIFQQTIENFFELSIISMSFCCTCVDHWIEFLTFYECRDFQL